MSYFATRIRLGVSLLLCWVLVLAGQHIYARLTNHMFTFFTPLVMTRPARYIVPFLMVVLLASGRHRWERAENAVCMFCWTLVALVYLAVLSVWL